MVQKFVKPENLGIEFDLGANTANKITVKIDGTLTKDPTTGAIGLDGGAITVVSADTGNIIRAGAANGALLTQADIKAVESVWTGSEADGFLQITPGGSNGHDVTYAFDWENAEFKERVQDAVGESLADGLNYDDALNAIQTNLGNIAFGNGLNHDTAGNITEVKADTASPSAVSVTAAGVSVTPGISTDATAGVNIAKLGADSKVYVGADDVTALASEEVQDAFGVKVGYLVP